MNKIYCGIDIGKLGGFAFIFSNNSTLTQETPLIKGTSEIDIRAIGEMFEDFGTETSIIVGIEDVHSIYGASAKSNFQFGRALGIIEGIIFSRNIQSIKVNPKKWQQVCFEGIPLIKKPNNTSKDTKAMALMAAKRLYPQSQLLSSPRATVENKGIVDALLIAHYLKIKNY